jgi:hypothetical protein
MPYNNRSHGHGSVHTLPETASGINPAHFIHLPIGFSVASFRLVDMGHSPVQIHLDQGGILIRLYDVPVIFLHMAGIVSFRFQIERHLKKPAARPHCPLRHFFHNHIGQVLPASLLPDPEHRLAASLFLGTALSISSVKIVAVVVHEMDFMRRDIGQIILGAAIIDDTIGWVLIAIIFGLAKQGAFDGWVLARKNALGSLLIISSRGGRFAVQTPHRISKGFCPVKKPEFSQLKPQIKKEPPA